MLDMSQSVKKMEPNGLRSKRTKSRMWLGRRIPGIVRRKDEEIVKGVSLGYVGRIKT
jgi:hypothetical protein